MKRTSFLALAAVALAVVSAVAFAAQPDLLAHVLQAFNSPADLGMALLANAPFAGMSSATIRRLQAKKSDAVEASRTLLDDATAADRDLTPEEQKAFAGHAESIKSLSARIEREQMLAAEEAGLAADGGVAVRAGATFKVSENVELDRKRGFKSFGEYAQSVKVAGVTGDRDKRLLIGAAAPGTAANEGVGADGGFLVPPDFSTELFRLSLAEDSLLPLTANTVTKSNSMVFPKTEQTPWGTNGVRAYWQNEAAAATASKPVLGTQQMRLSKLMALVPVTDELLADAPALESELMPLISDSIRWKTNEAILFGLGNGQPIGAANSGALIVVAKESGQATLTLQVLNVAKMVSRLPPGSYARAIWVINNDVLPALFTLALGNYPIYMAAGAAVGGVQVNPYGTLLGRPIVVSQHAATFSAQADVQLHDLSYYRTLTQAQGIETATSMHLYFDADATAFRVIFRMDGAPKIAAAISPAKGSNTLSPFTVLAAR